ncbi:4-(cytidine 5'-diphospho)-2-C-methyl-D-erythritol kinase, partial [bacterium]
LSLKELIMQGMNDPRILSEKLMNDFEPAVFKAYPEIGRLKEEMLAAGAVYSAMSGSGSSVYGLFREGAGAESLAALLRARGYRTFTTSPHFLPAE